MASASPSDSNDGGKPNSSHPSTPTIPNPFASAFPTATSSTNTSPSSPDPPPPLPVDLDNPTPSEETALDNWLRRNTSYITTIPWHRYQRLPVLSPLWGIGEADYRAECLESLLFYTRASGRRFTDDERNAVLEPITRTAIAASYDRPIALGIAGWLMARSWSKSGRQVAARAAAAAAATTTPSPLGTGTVGPDGHITHFSNPAQYSRGGNRSQVLMSLFLRAARAGGVGLVCGLAYYSFWTPWRIVLGEHEVLSIREDLRLESVCRDMDHNMKDKMADMLKRHGGS